MSEASENWSSTLNRLCPSDPCGPDWSRERGGRGPDTDPGSAVDHHPAVPDRTH